MKPNRIILLLFIFLEFIAIALTIAANSEKSIYILNAFSKIETAFLSYKFRIEEIFTLRENYRKLLDKMQQLYTQKFNCQKWNDTIYNLVLAKVVSNSISSQNNLIIISAGKKQGIKIDDGVISVYGNAIGSIIYVGENYSAVLSILNKISSLSVIHKPSGVIGQLSWNGLDPKIMTLEGIPLYIKIKVGDSIFTSGYSQIFPKDIFVGTIKSYSITKTKNTYTIKVELAEDFRKLNYVFVITNKARPEIKKILKEAKNIID